MKLSIEWIRDYVDLPAELSLKEIMHDLTMATVEVENAEDPGVALDHVVVGRIVEVATLDAKDASLATCDIGGSAPVHIVCSGTGMAPGVDTIVALPGARIRPTGMHDHVVVAAREAAGQHSDGAICRASEIGLDDVLLSPDSQAVVDVAEFNAAPGTPLAEAIGWHDIVLDIDNKSLTNRPDLWCHRGIALELAAIYDRPLRNPALVEPDWPPVQLLGEIDPELCRRFAAFRLEHVAMGPSPFWLRSRLARLGQRPINVVVDLTNYVMLDVGQPNHAYDNNRLTLPLGMRRARTGETLALLDGSEHHLAQTNTVITGADEPVAAAGVMGGASSMVTETTTAVTMEFANFDALATRRSASAMSLRTEASVRFEKSLDTQRVDLGVSRFAALVQQCLPEARITAYDVRANAATEPARITVSADFLLSRLGKAMDAGDIAKQLAAVGFEVDAASDVLRVTAPSWRSTGDVSMAHDLIEELARLHGYENFPPTMPTIELGASTTSRNRDVERNIKHVLASQGGMQEVVLYPWVKDRYLDATGFDPSVGLRLADPPGPDQASLQPSLVPGLVECIEANLRFEMAFRVFTCDDVYGVERSALFQAGEELPSQQRHVSGAFVGRDLQSLVREARGVLDTVFRAAHLAPYHTEPTTDAAWAAPGAQLALKNEAGTVGIFGVISERTRHRAGLKRAEAVIFTLFLEALKPFGTRENTYRPPPVYQEAEKDFSMIFPVSVKWQKVLACLKGIDALIRNIGLVDVYRGQGIPDDHQSITLRVTLGADDRTLESAEIEATSGTIVNRLTTELGGSLRA